MAKIQLTNPFLYDCDTTAKNNLMLQLPDDYRRKLCALACGYVVKRIKDEYKNTPRHTIDLLKGSQHQQKHINRVKNRYLREFIDCSIAGTGPFVRPLFKGTLSHDYQTKFKRHMFLYISKNRVFRYQVL